MPIRGLLGVMFIGLKLTHYIGWSWMWVLAPFWVPAVIPAAVLLIGIAAIIRDPNRAHTPRKSIRRR